MSNYQDFDGLLALLKVAEELLFSFPLPSNVITKYEFIRGKTFSKYHIPYSGSHIRRLQLDALSKLDKDSEKVVNTSTLDIKDMELQNKYQQSSLYIQKLFNLIEKNLKFQEQVITNCSMICNPEEFGPNNSKNNKNLLDLPIKQLDIDEINTEKLIEDYRKNLSQKEGEIVNKLELIEDTIRSKNVYIRKLEQEIHGNRNGQNNYKTEIQENYDNLKDKFVKQKNDYEKKIKELREEMLISKGNFLNDARKAQLKEIEHLMQERDMYKEQAESLNNELETVSSSLQKEISILNDEYEKNTQEIVYSLTNKNKDLEYTLKEKIEQLEKTLFYREKELLDELNNNSQNNTSKIEELEKELSFFKNNSEALQNCIDCVQAVVTKVYRRYSEKNEDLGDLTNTLIKQVEFLDSVFSKLTCDNNWLIERISEIGKENENMKNNMKTATVHETLNELNASSSVLKSFEVSRERLKKKLSESMVEFPNTYSKLAHKYNSNY